MLLLEQDITRKRQVDNKVLPELKKEFEAGNNKEYKVEIIIDSAVYSQQANSNQIPGLYYLILWKGYPKKKNNWELSSVVIHLWKLISIFHKKYPKKLTVTSSPLDSAPLIARPTVPKELKQKRGHGSKKTNKRGRN